MNRREAIGALAGLLGTAWIDPRKLIGEAKRPLRFPQSFTIEKNSGFLLKRIRTFPDNAEGFSIRILFNGTKGLILPGTPCDNQNNPPNPQPGRMVFNIGNGIYLPPDSKIELIGDLHSTICFDGDKLYQNFPHSNEVEVLPYMYALCGHE